MMTKKAAWLYIAKVFSTPREKRSMSEDYLTAYGLCHAIKRLARAHDEYVFISQRCEKSMLADLEPTRKKLKKETEEFFWPIRKGTVNHDKERAALARKLATASSAITSPKR